VGPSNQRENNLEDPERLVSSKVSLHYIYQGKKKETGLVFLVVCVCGRGVVDGKWASASAAVALLL
jgi:hypothetical protein